MKDKEGLIVTANVSCGGSNGDVFAEGVQEAALLEFTKNGPVPVYLGTPTGDALLDTVVGLGDTKDGLPGQMTVKIDKEHSREIRRMIEGGDARCVSMGVGEGADFEMQSVSISPYDIEPLTQRKENDE